MESVAVRQFAKKLYISSSIAAIHADQGEYVTVQDKVNAVMKSFETGFSAILANVRFRIVGNVTYFSVIADKWTMVCEIDTDIDAHFTPGGTTYIVNVYGSQSDFENEIMLMMVGGDEYVEAA